MQKDRLVFGLTAIFAAMTVLVALVGVVFLEPVLFVVAVPLGLAAVLFWYQSSGALRERIEASRTVTDRGSGGARGGFGAGPREGFESARGQQARDRWERRQRQQRQGRRPGPPPATGMSPTEAYRQLGLETGADEGEIQRAYREKVKEVHPDRGGDEEEFKKVTEAYETLKG